MCLIYVLQAIGYCNQKSTFVLCIFSDFSLPCSEFRFSTFNYPQMIPNKEIFQYYETLANQYDSDRFGNTYGAFIHQQEREILAQYLPLNRTQILDMGCGTGRLMEFATTGIDLSPNMIQVAKQKFPDKSFTVGSVLDLPFAAETFEAVFCFHVLMHLDVQSLSQMLANAHRVLTPEGICIIDFPSLKRRKLLGQKPEGWHAAFALDKKMWQDAIGDKWKVMGCTGILFLPIHRFPPRIRKYMIQLDKWLCRSWLKNYASYMCIVLQKK